MSLALVQTRALLGVAAPAVQVEVHLANGLPGFTIVGLPEAAVKESKDRVRSALLTSHFDFPTKRITVNLAPADLPKNGGRYDLAIALGILAASEQVPAQDLDRFEWLGELALTGELRSVPGVIASARAAELAGRCLVGPAGNANQLAFACPDNSRTAQSLSEIAAFLHGRTKLSPPQADAEATHPTYPDLADVKGQYQARRALEVAAAGQHNLLFYGPPGTGKSMLAARLGGILPPLDHQEALEVASVQSLLGHQQATTWSTRPFRAPHHTASAIALVGGGSQPKPGEISLAHKGVLFLDELPEFPRAVLEVLREPLETGRIAISRANAQVEFPAEFQLIAAMNPCPCGYAGDPSDRCQCKPAQLQRYRQKISGPLLDRIDMQVPVHSLPISDLQNHPQGESSSTVRERVHACHQRQIARQNCANSRLKGRALRQHCALDVPGKQLLEQAVNRWRLSARSYDRILRVARTLADLQNSAAIEVIHLSEALSYRGLER